MNVLNSKYVKPILFIIILLLTTAYIRPYSQPGIVNNSIILLYEGMLLIIVVFIIKKRNIPLKIKFTFFSIIISTLLIIPHLLMLEFQSPTSYCSGISLYLLIVYILVAFVEELTFRLYLDQAFKFNKLLKVIFLSVIFALMHDNVSKSQFLIRFLLSLFMYYILYKTNDIMVPIITHFLYNFVGECFQVTYPINCYYVMIHFSILFAIAYIIFKIREVYNKAEYNSVKTKNII